MKHLTCLVALLAAPALATPGFPGGIKTALSLSAEPGCEVCHQGGIGSSSTVTVPFGVTMKANGLKKNDNASLSAALAAITTAKTDSDADGVSDIDELKAGTDPNKAAVVVTDGGVPEDNTIRYGCFAQSAPQFALTGFPMLAALLLLRRHRRR